jgi:diguanylate cyclase (GGDEF)-like protein
LYDDWKECGEQHPLSIVFLDIDHFKSINDRYDHSTGDRVLIDLVRLLQDELYSGELVARYGGEEFVVICPETTLEQAVERAERLRRSVMGMTIGNTPGLQVTASFGVAEIESPDTVESLLQRADKALYNAKRTGRNKTCHEIGSDAPSEIRQEKTARIVGSPLVYKATFLTCDASGALVQKLGGFVDDNRGKVIDVGENNVTFEIGKAAFLGGWGRHLTRQPVRLKLEIGAAITKPGGKSASSRREVAVTVTPEGKPKDDQTFQKRAAQVVELLRSYCVAE